jgi:hypothetical protein
MLDMLNDMRTKNRIEVIAKKGTRKVRVNRRVGA